MTGVEPDKSWKRFQRLRFSSRDINRHMKRAESATTRHARRFIFRRVDNIRLAKRQITTWLIVVGLLIVATWFQVVWFQDSYQTKAPSEGGTYAEATIGPIDTLNPLYASTDAEVSASRLMFSSLYNYDTSGHLSRDLAKKITISPDSKVYTVDIRKDVHWSDGANLTAEDVEFTINLIKDPLARSPMLVNWQDIDVKAVDDDSVQFTLPAVYAAFPQALTFPVLPKHILGSVPAATVRENGFSQNPVGSGPFTFRLLQKVDVNQSAKTLHLTGNSDYYGGAPKLARFEIHAYKDEEAMSKALALGEVNAASGLSSKRLDGLNKNRFKIVDQPINSGVYSLFNTNNPILKDKSIRRALRAAVDTQVLRSKLAANQPGLDLPFIPSQVDGAELPAAPAPDPKEASVLLDKAGWKMKGEFRQKANVPLRFTITTVKNTNNVVAAKSLAEQWKKIGVDATVSVIDTSNPSVNFLQDTLQPRNFDVLIYELIIGADPDVYAYWHSSQAGINGYNLSSYSDPLSDAILASARSRVEPEIREAKYVSFAKQWLSDAPAIGLYQPVLTYVTNKNIESFKPSNSLVSPSDRFADILYWSVDSQSVYKTP